MTIVFKRPDSPMWYVTKTKQSTRTTNKKEAEELARKILSGLWRENTLGEHVYTWKELCDAWLDIKSHKRSIEVDHQVMREFPLLNERSTDMPLREITSELVLGYGKHIKTRASASTANRHLGVLAAMLKLAVKRRMITGAPFVDKYEMAKKEPRWLTHEEFNRFVALLPLWVADMATVAVQTGMRYSNVAGLRWEWLNAQHTVCVVPAVYTKTGRTYTVPLSAVAREVIGRQGAKVSGLVFSRPDGIPITAVRYWWARACKQSGIKVRFHDLRHTWASAHVQNGTPDRILMHMGGWSSSAMLANYAHLSTEHLEKFADNGIGCR